MACTGPARTTAVLADEIRDSGLNSRSSRASSRACWTGRLRLPRLAVQRAAAQDLGLDGLLCWLSDRRCRPCPCVRTRPSGPTIGRARIRPDGRRRPRTRGCCTIRLRRASLLRPTLRRVRLSTSSRWTRPRFLATLGMTSSDGRRRGAVRKQGEGARHLPAEPPPRYALWSPRGACAP